MGLGETLNNKNSMGCGVSSLRGDGSNHLRARAVGSVGAT
jgi:hypothetical protein